MKFIISSQVLLKHLQLISGVLNNNNTLPILDNFLFEIKEKQLTISASDLETTINTSFEIESKDDVSIAIPAKLLMDTLRSFPEQPLTFDINLENYHIDISAGEGNYQFTGYNGDEFPRLPELEVSASIKVPGEVMSDAIHKTVFAAGNDELRPVMSGIFFELNTEEVKFVATDAHKLVRYTRKDISASTEVGFIVPKKPLNLLKNTLSGSDTEVLIEYNETNVRFSFEDIQLVSRLIEGKYPNYEAVIPADNPYRMVINRLDFMNALKRVSIFSNKSTHQVRLKMSGSELELSAEDLDFSNAAKERHTCNYTGDDMEIGFNSRFLIEMLTNLDSDEVNFEMSAPNRAGILLPSEKNDENEDVLMLVMPVMLNN
jgi:DNA polymerase-3 subunit beta